MVTPTCACARNTDGTTTTLLCSVHADTDPCFTYSIVTGRRRKGTIRRGRCTNCGHHTEGGIMPARKPHVGDSADHKSRSLDPRPVAEVSQDGTQIKILIHTLVTDWLPAENYTYKAPRS